MQIEALKECGVRNIEIDFSYFLKADLDGFDNIIVNSGKTKKVTADKYYSTIKEYSSSYKFSVLQYDVQHVALNLSYYNMGIDMNIPNLVPIIHDNYSIGMTYLSPMLKSDIVALGRGVGNLEEDELLKKLPSKNKYHGIAKTRWFGKVHSVDTTSWLSLLRTGKTYIQTPKGKKEIKKESGEMLDAIMDNYEYISKCGVTINNTTKDKLKTPIALYYMPLLESMGYFDKNFR